MFSPDQVFVLVIIGVLPAWALLFVAPRWRFTRLVTAYLTPGAIALVYLAVLFARLPAPGAGFGTPEQLAPLYQDPWIVLVAWIHYLVLDLFTGAWMVRDSLRLRVPHRYVVPSLALTLAAGPLGLLTYFAVRGFVVRRWPSTGPVVVGVEMELRDLEARHAREREEFAHRHGAR